MDCPVCTLKVDEPEVLCPQCGWEFRIYLTKLSEAEEALYRKKLEIARQNWHAMKELQSKLQELESKIKNQKYDIKESLSKSELCNKRFRIVDNDVVEDNKTGLMWTRDIGRQFPYLSWREDAETWVSELSTGPYSDWRISTERELVSLIDTGRQRPALPCNHPFRNIKKYIYKDKCIISVYEHWQKYAHIDIWYGKIISRAGGWGGHVWPVRGRLQDT
ncbi:DUF1566 domain-containing protein [Desulforhabdus sp. TSK]|uniref:Lcl C-terminal domain-containing protein n=1 Tax=Desulforhabdus sp. TSK TaxID=2925014 RepID=UPI001FC897DC|nr:DUF1566 domain-containing protein [Desulforhabdus sp. TSK]GKT09147.1 hypothetical protein DSTSK_24520 [Desulforhabdus sp. TSK]